VNLADTGNQWGFTLQVLLPTHATPLLLAHYPGQKAGLCVRSIGLSGHEVKGNPHGQINILLREEKRRTVNVFENTNKVTWILHYRDLSTRNLTLATM
jgi:hypothetical protein